MELYQLNTFVKIADLGSLTRAAEQLFTSQPAVSAQVKALEDELGVILFERTSRGMQLTAKGRLLYDQAIATLEAAARLKADALQLRREVVGEVRVGVHTDFDFMRVGELHRLLAGRYPRVAPHFVQSMSAQILPDLRRGALDGGFHFGPCRSSDLLTLCLAEVPMRVVGPVAWAERIETASLPELATLPWVYTSDTCPFYALNLELFGELDVVPPRVAYCDSEDAVRELIRAGAGLSMLREDDALRLHRRGEAAIWSGTTPAIELGFAVQRQRAGEPLVEALMSVVKAMWQGAGAEIAEAKA